MAKIALIEAKPSKNDYIRLFDNEFEFDGFFEIRNSRDTSGAGSYIRYNVFEVSI